ncbi:MAG TPA: alkaline phosphatase family protein, partial [Anaerolineae bacterium]
NTRLPVNATVLHGKTLWRLLSDAGKKVGVINVPVTFPPEKINGFMVSGFPMPTDTRNYTYPPELAAELEAHGWNLSDIALQSPSLDERDAFIDSLYRRQEERTQATLYLMEKYEWDVFMVHMFETDRLQHLVMNQWARWTTQHTNETDQHFAEALEKFFQAMDEVLKRIWRRLDEIAPGSTLIVMSDHGFGPVDKAVHPYNLLREAGLLRLKPTLGVGFKRALARVGFTPLNAFNWMPQGLRRQLTNDSDVATVDSEAKSEQSGGLLPSIAKAARRSANNAILSFKDVDWERTRAYCLGNSGMIHISVNLKGRELHGSVLPEDYEKTREEIIKTLHAWRD